MDERVDEGLMAHLKALHREKERLIPIANVAVMEAKLAEAKVDLVHNEIIACYDLRQGDKYDENGVITKAPRGD